MLKFLLAALRNVFGVPLVDQTTGAVIGRVLVIGWKGKLRLIGLNGIAVRPVFQPQARETYWAQDLGFSTHEVPDFERVASEGCDSSAVASESGGGAGDVRSVAGSES